MGNVTSTKFKGWKAKWNSILSGKNRTKSVVIEAAQKTQHNLAPLIPTSIVQKSLECFACLIQFTLTHLSWYFKVHLWIRLTMLIGKICIKFEISSTVENTKKITFLAGSFNLFKCGMCFLDLHLQWTVGMEERANILCIIFSGV